MKKTSDTEKQERKTGFDVSEGSFKSLSNENGYPLAYVQLVEIEPVTEHARHLKKILFNYGKRLTANEEQTYDEWLTRAEQYALGHNHSLSHESESILDKKKAMVPYITIEIKEDFYQPLAEAEERLGMSRVLESVVKLHAAGWITLAYRLLLFRGLPYNRYHIRFPSPDQTAGGENHLQNPDNGDELVHILCSLRRSFRKTFLLKLAGENLPGIYLCACRASDRIVFIGYSESFQPVYYRVLPLISSFSETLEVILADIKTLNYSDPFLFVNDPSLADKITSFEVSIPACIPASRKELEQAVDSIRNKIKKPADCADIPVRTAKTDAPSFYRIYFDKKSRQKEMSKLDESLRLEKDRIRNGETNPSWLRYHSKDRNGNISPNAVAEQQRNLCGYTAYRIIADKAPEGFSAATLNHLTRVQEYLFHEIDAASSGTISFYEAQARPGQDLVCFLALCLYANLLIRGETEQLGLPVPLH